MRRLIPVIFVLAPSLLACTTGRQAYIPVDSPLKTWTPPEPDAYAPDQGKPSASPPASPAPATEKSGAR